MKYRVPVACRSYGDLVIAQTLVGVRTSAAGESRHEAVGGLTDLLRDILGRLHPRILAGLGGAWSFESKRVDLPIYELRLGVFGDNEDDALSMPVDLVASPLGDRFELVGAPVFDEWMWVEQGGDLVDAAEKGLGRRRDTRSRTAALHREAPAEVALEFVEVEFEPVEVAELPLEQLWLDARPEDNDDESAEEGALADVAEPWTDFDEQERRRRGLVEMFDHEETLDHLREMLLAEAPAAVVLVGPPRVGKTSHIRHLAGEWAVTDESPSIWFADPPRLVSADVMSGGWREQCSEIVDELVESGDTLYMGQIGRAHV